MMYKGSWQRPPLDIYIAERISRANLHASACGYKVDNVSPIAQNNQENIQWMQLDANLITTCCSPFDILISLEMLSDGWGTHSDSGTLGVPGGNCLKH